MTGTADSDGGQDPVHEPDRTARASQEDTQKHEPWRVEGERGDAKGATASPPLPGGKWLWVLVAGMLVVNFALASRVPRDHARLSIPYSEFRKQAQQGNVKKVSSKSDTIQGDFRRDVRWPRGSKGKVTHLFKTERPAFADDRILGLLLRKGVQVDAKPQGERSLLATLLFGFGPTLLLVGLFVLLMRRAATSAGGGMMGMGRSKARRYDASGERTTFADVAGIDEAEEELAEIVDFLKDPDRYRRLGGTIPKGVLVTGLPGTGKTLLARAVAGEADVPFFSLSASEFVEMIVGVGASRARDLFAQAKAAAPAIIFIDELDAIGRARGAGALSGGHDEREQTLNQILTEMDGFTGNEGVIVLAATNRPEILDPALLRPGRFDRRVTVNPPDQQGRLHILEVHTRGVPLAEDLDLAAIASTTPGMVGADLRNLVNEAALRAARRSVERVEAADFTEALEKIVLGAERHIMLSEGERRRTAYHESGHALLGMLMPGADPVRKVSIIPRGRALGVTFQSPDSDRYGYTRTELHGKIVGMLGGRAAEELVYEEVTTGAESDLEHATHLARHMSGRWGMSEAIGLVSVLPADERDRPFFPGAGAPSERTRQSLDEEVRRLTEDCYEEALTVLRAHRPELDALAGALLERETLDEPDAYRAAGVEPHSDRVAREPIGP